MKQRLVTSLRYTELSLGSPSQYKLVISAMLEIVGALARTMHCS
jgi:hypothetical protein